MANVIHADDQATFKREVLDSTVPVMVDFWAAWCGPCRGVAPEVEALADQYGAAIKVVKVDVDANQAIASQYDIRGIPMIGLFEGGKLTKQVVGARPRQAIETELGLARFARREELIMHAIETTTTLSMAEAEAAVREALATQGFGVLTEIDVAATLKAKLGVERSPLKILGACNPTFAHRALELDEFVSLLLPCNVVLAATGDGTRISAVDPRELMAGDAFQQLANEAAALLTAALAAVPSA